MNLRGMNLREALEIVYELADENALDHNSDFRHIGPGEDMYVQAMEQREALDVVHSLFELCEGEKLEVPEEEFEEFNEEV